MTLSPMKSSKGSLPEFPAPQTHLYLPSPDLRKEGPLPDRRLHLLAMHVTLPHGLFQNFTLSPLFQLLLLFSYPLVLKHLKSSFKKWYQKKIYIYIYIHTHTETKLKLSNPHLLLQVQSSVPLTPNIWLLYFSHELSHGFHHITTNCSAKFLK